MRRIAGLARGRGAGLAESLDAANVPRLCAGKQYPVAAEPQRLPLRARRYPRSEGRTAAVARSLGDTGLHELPLVEGRRQQQLHRHLRNQRRADALRRRQTAHGGQGTEASKPHRRTLGRRIRERHPHRHRRSLHAGALRRRSRESERIDPGSEPSRMRTRPPTSRSRKHSQKRPGTTGSASEYRQVPAGDSTSHPARLQTTTETTPGTGRRIRDEPLHPHTRHGKRTGTPTHQDRCLSLCPRTPSGDRSRQTEYTDIRPRHQNCPRWLSAYAEPQRRHRNQPCQRQ